MIFSTIHRRSNRGNKKMVSRGRRFECIVIYNLKTMIINQCVYRKKNDFLQETAYFSFCNFSNFTRFEKKDDFFSKYC